MKSKREMERDFSIKQHMRIFGIPPAYQELFTLICKNYFSAGKLEGMDIIKNVVKGELQKSGTKKVVKSSRNNHS